MYTPASSRRGCFTLRIEPERASARHILAKPLVLVLVDQQTVLERVILTPYLVLKFEELFARVRIDDPLNRYWCAFVSSTIRSRSDKLRSEIDVRIACQPKPMDKEDVGNPEIRDAQIHMFKQSDVASRRNSSIECVWHG